MSLQLIYPYTNPTNYIFDNSKISVDGVAKLKLINNPGQDFIQNFDNDTGFVYDPSKAEFVAGKLQQIAHSPADATFGANYNSDINGNWGNGVLTGVPIGGAAVSGGKLDLTGGTAKYVDYDAALNADSQQRGTIKFKATPNYSGSPLINYYLFNISKQSGSNINQITLRHSTAGSLIFYIRDSAGNIITTGLTAVWSPTLGQEYEIELNWDITTGEQRLFIDGVQLGTTKTGTGTRSSDIGLLRIGAEADGVVFFDGKTDDLIIFSTVQHTANYTPGYTVIDYKYLNSKVTLPEMEYIGTGTLISFDLFTTTESGSPRYIIQIGRSGDYLYWSGSAWVVSDGTYAQANDKTTFNSNVSTLPINGEIYGQFEIIFPDNNTISDIDILTASLTAQIYPTDNSTIEVLSAIFADKIDNAIETSSIPVGDQIKWVVKADSNYYYISGGVPTITDGATYAESNTIAEWAVIWPSWDPPSAQNLKFKAFLHSDDGSSTPELDELSVFFDFQGQADDISKTIVWGKNFEPYGTLKISLSEDVVRYKDNIILRKQFNNGDDIIIDSEGYWEFELPESVNQPSGIFYIFKFTDKEGAKTSYRARVPDTDSRAFWLLDDILKIK